MPQAQHGKKSVRSYEKGTDVDSDSELVPTGWALRMRNLRSTFQGAISAVKKIFGEIIQYINSDNRNQGGSGNPFPLTYECIGKAVVNSHIVEFWADKNTITPGLPYVRVDGWVVLMASTLANFPISVTYPIQTHKNDSCVGGEVFATDFQPGNPPFVLNVEDMLMNAGINPATNQLDIIDFPPTQKYFSGFNISKYQVQLNRPIDHPVFIEVCSASSTPNVIGTTATSFGTGGLPVGVYQYSINFLDSGGNTTPFSEATPLIALPKGLDTTNQTPNVPSLKTYGAAPNISALTSFGIHIRFRCTNIGNFSTIQVKRTTWNTGTPLQTAGTESIISTIPISKGFIGIYDFYDQGLSVKDIPATPDQVSDTLDSIDSAKALRYYNSRLDLFNIKYASKDTNGLVSFTTRTGNTFGVAGSGGSGVEMYPISSALGVSGYRDIWNNVYRKGYMRGNEQYGFAAVFFDNNGSRSFAASIPNTGASPNAWSYAMPGRRDACGGDSLTNSPTLASNPRFTAAANSNISVGTVSQTFECFDLVGARQKTESGINNGVFGEYVNMVEAGNKNGTIAFNYHSLHPQKDTDASSLIDLNYQINITVENGGYANSWVSYTPTAFAPNYYALGMSLQGISKMPSWVQAFSICRTAPAGWVIAQGLASYYLQAQRIGLFGFSNKDISSVWWDSPDLQLGIVPSTSIIPGTTKVQLAAPYGIFSEVYNNYDYRDTGAGSIGDVADVIAYARIIEDSGQINPSSNDSVAGIPKTISAYASRYVSFDSWRNPTNTNHSGQIFTMQNFGLDGLGSQHRGKPYKITLNSNIYDFASPSGFTGFYDNATRAFHEPFYAVNLINDAASISAPDVQQYYETGTYIKINSIIGIGDGVKKSFYLVDERWEDCIPALQSYYPRVNEDRYIVIQDTTNNTEQYWLNVTWKSAGTITNIKNSIHTNGFYVSTKKDGTTVNVTGIFTNTNTNDRLFKIIFNQIDVLGNPFIPAPSSNIVVRYDNNAPIEVYGGDTYVGEYTYCPVDLNTGNGSGGNRGHLAAPDLSLPFQQAFPFDGYGIIESDFICTDTDGGQGVNINEVQASNQLYFGSLNQLLINGIVESRANTALDFGVLFPHVNHVQRPYAWGAGHGTNIFAQYFTDYPSEDNLWGFGGFRWASMNNGVVNNIDYAEVPFNTVQFGRPRNYVDKTSFCSRGIWSNIRGINETSGSAGLLTFPPLNIFDLGDETGEIKFAWDALSGSGSNLYAFTENGIALVLTEKRLLTQLSGQQLATMGDASTDVMQEAVWISKVTGMNDEMWRSAAEWDNVLRFANKNSAYEFSNNKLTDIGRRKFHRRLYNNFLSKIFPGYQTDVTGVYDTLFNEYFLQIRQRHKAWNIYGGSLPFIQILPFGTAGNWSVSNGDVIDLYVTNLPQTFRLPLMSFNFPFKLYTLSFVNNSAFSVTIYDYAGNLLQVIGAGMSYTFTGGFVPSTTIPIVTVTAGTPNEMKATLVYSEQTQSWQDTFDYNFDKYVSFDNKTYGMRAGATWLLNSGQLINGANIIGEVVGICNDVEPLAKEFVRMRVNSDNMPSTIQFFDTIQQVEANQPQSILDTTANVYALKIRNGFDQYVGRRTASPNLRMQGRVMLFKISHFTTAQEFKVISTEVQFKNLK
jgi:hypothetical protein